MDVNQTYCGNHFTIHTNIESCCTPETNIILCFYEIFIFLKILLIYFQTEGKGGRKKGQKHQCVVASHVPPIGDLACNPGMCSDWEQNQQPVGSQASTQSTDPHQPGLILYFKYLQVFLFLLLCFILFVCLFFYFFYFLVLFNYSCVPFLPSPPPHSR